MSVADGGMVGGGGVLRFESVLKSVASSGRLVPPSRRAAAAGASFARCSRSIVTPRYECASICRGDVLGLMLAL
ncbi:MAG: hypothetical protein GBQ79_12240 [Halomonas sp.]|nr:hypothetical protein [Halomonas sp.]